ncbi:sulfurtransferase [Celeribacter indicus]|uniref:3-mercaptopyruvate sulfurtransferase n=1 Tax=Celeribacter indicus TaxID=1208324 RepID=A0A0B5DZ84_9RHOB|nr:rhodanese-like domain-containing protein [Celeribacter indicus]AJE48728.1 3-mercaptopyruvate sulfurtransferase [Celeribacter indicus]SDX11969.1 thiosulfate/3-mercaptopyruvate sulfurtransferase [Celeribacter indicus]
MEEPRGIGQGMTQAPDLPVSLLVDPDWLAGNLDRVVLLDASVARIDRPGGVTGFGSGADVFAGKHLPGARLADLFGGFSDADAPLSFTRPSVDVLERSARELGVNRDSVVVVYDRLGGAYAARIWLLFRSVGFDRVRVLNGGLQAWTAAGGAVESGPSAPVALGDFRAGPLREEFVSTEEVARLVAGGGDAMRPLVCGLRPPQFTGEGSDDPRLGHIPGSVNLPFSELLDEEGRLDLNRVETRLKALALPEGSVPVLYCGGGINASGLALALVATGHSEFRVYEASMSGWTLDPSRPVARGKATA